MWDWAQGPNDPIFFGEFDHLDVIVSSSLIMSSATESIGLILDHEIEDGFKGTFFPFLLDLTNGRYEIYRLEGFFT